MESGNSWQGLLGGLFTTSTGQTAHYGANYGVGQQNLQNYAQQFYGIQAPVFYTPAQMQMLYRQLGMRSPRVIRRQPRTGFDAYEQKHRALTQDSTEESEGMEGFHGMINNFLMGCDPEFVALDGTGVQINLANFFSGDGEIGYDHGGRVGEFRPEATRGTYALTKRLQRLIKSPTVERVRASKLRAGARVDRDVIGGHVHFGFACPQTAGDARIKALDRITRVLEALDILPSEESKLRRGSGAGYGRWSDIRNSNGHTEYRTMASWLTDPRVAYLCLTAAKLAASDPTGTIANLKTTASFNELVEWFRTYRTKDINARRALERVLSLGHPAVRVYPDVDFRERWRELGL
jgi:Phage phiEco32-like COOH.NH2 ligase-type 2